MFKSAEVEELSLLLSVSKPSEIVLKVVDNQLKTDFQAVLEALRLQTPLAKDIVSIAAKHSFYSEKAYIVQYLAEKLLDLFFNPNILSEEDISTIIDSYEAPILQQTAKIPVQCSKIQVLLQEGLFSVDLLPGLKMETSLKTPFKTLLNPKIKIFLEGDAFYDPTEFDLALLIGLNLPVNTFPSIPTIEALNYTQYSLITTILSKSKDHHHFEGEVCLSDSSIHFLSPKIHTLQVTSFSPEMAAAWAAAIEPTLTTTTAKCSGYTVKSETFPSLQANLIRSVKLLANYHY